MTWVDKKEPWQQQPCDLRPDGVCIAKAAVACQCNRPAYQLVKGLAIKRLADAAKKAAK